MLRARIGSRPLRPSPRPVLFARRRFALEAAILEERLAPAVITVTTLADGVAVDGKVTLLEAIQAANGDKSVDGSVPGNGPDTIVFAPSVQGGTVSLFTVADGSAGPAAFGIDSDVTIAGTGEAIERNVGASSFRLFFVGPPGRLTLRDLELRRGFAVGGFGGGGAAGLGGAVWNLGVLIAEGCLFESNRAAAGNGGFANTSGSGGGGVGGNAQGLVGGPPNGGANGGFPGGFGGGGGGADVSSGLPGGKGGFGGGGGSTVANGKSGGAGGFGGGGGGGGVNSGLGGAAGYGGGPGGDGVFNPGGAGGGLGAGGAVFNQGGTVTLDSCTFVGNSVEGGKGGDPIFAKDGGGNPIQTSNAGGGGSGLGAGLFNLDGTATVRNCTFVGNTVAGGIPGKTIVGPAPPTGKAAGGAVYSVQLPGGTANLVLANNILFASVGGVDAFIDGGSSTGGPNLIGSNSGVPAALIVSTADPQLGPLQDNGGGTPTRAPAVAGPAVNAGNAAFAPAFDQRGFNRVVDGKPDLGAVEHQPPATSVTVTASGNPTELNTPVTFTATVAGVAAGSNVPVGSVTFFLDGAQIGSPVVLSAGQGKLVTSAVPLGTHAVTAKYGGFSVGTYVLDPSNSPPLAHQIVQTLATTTVVSASVNPALAGDPVTFFATVTAGGTAVPGGSVTFFADGASIGKAAVVGGTAKLETSFLLAGERVVTAQYGGFAQGDFIYSPGTSGPLSHTTQPKSVATTTTLTAAPNPVATGIPVTFTATVTQAGSGPPPGGTVTFLLNGTALGTVGLNGATAALTTTLFDAGMTSITARYEGFVQGSVTFAQSTSAPVSLTVTPNVLATGTILAVSLNPVPVGTPVTLTATVQAVGGAAAPPGGTVTFFVDGVVLGTTSLSGSVVTLTTQFASPGARVLIATYGGFEQGGFAYRASASNELTLTVSRGSPQIPPQPFAVGVGQGGGASVTVYNPNGSVKFMASVLGGFAGGARVAMGDLNADKGPDVIAGTGPGAATLVRLLDGRAGDPLGEIAPFEPSFTGGVFVAAGDVNGDGRADVVVSPDEGGGPRVRVLSGADPSVVLADFFGIEDPAFRGGARVALGDVNGDGVLDLLVGAGFGGGPRLAAFDGKSVGAGQPVKLFSDFFVFEPTLRNGVFAAAGDLDGDGFGEVIVGGGPGGGPRVFALSGKDLVESGGTRQLATANFFAGNESNRGGVRIAVTYLDGDRRADLLAGDGTDAGSRVTVYLGKDVLPEQTPPEALAFDAFPGFGGGVYVG